MFKLVFLVFFIFSAAPVSAQVNSEKPELITLYVAEIRVLSVNNPTRVVINNPNILDVSSVSKDDIIVAAKNPGITNLLWWDTAGQHTIQVEVFQEDMNLVKKRVDSLLKGLNLPDVITQPSDGEGKVILLGSVKTLEELERIETALALLKVKTINLIQLKEERASIEIDAMVLELKKDASKTLGLAWPTSVTLTEPASRGWATLGGIPDALVRISSWTRDAFSVTLDFLIKEGSARVLSRPRLVCQSGKEAELLMGGEKPIMTTVLSSSSSGEGTNVEYKEYGIKLKIKPKLVSDGKIELALNVEVSDIGVAETLGSSTSPTAKAYPLTKRSTSTQVYLNDGQTMAISGLIKQKSEEELQKFPWLGDVPVLGVFFRHKTFTSGGGLGELSDSELVITLTPKIIKEFIAKEVPNKEVPKVELTPVIKAVVTNDIAAPVMSEYVRKITKRLQDNFVYPWTAKRDQLQGLVRLGLRLDSLGTLLDVEIKQSSGYSIFDENAVSMIKKLSPYPPLPSKLNQEELRIDIPIVYKLK
ncbi:MAG: TonB family protein [Candidatus Omnitrophota bacterium]